MLVTQAGNEISKIGKAPATVETRYSLGHSAHSGNSRYVKEIMETAKVADTPLDVSKVALGTWAMGGWMWGGSDEAESIATIRAAVEQGINMIDTAPVYGFGQSEAIVGKALAEGGLRAKVQIATKVGLEWRDGKVYLHDGAGNVVEGRELSEVEVEQLCPRETVG